MTPTSGSGHMFDQSVLSAVHSTYHYEPIPQRLRIGQCDDADFFRKRFLLHDSAHLIAEVDNAKAAIVTGYGPTNAPTAGTLSAILATRELQRRTGLHTTIVISDLGAWNSRNLPWPRICDHRDQMLRFLRAIGFDDDNCSLRTHQDERNLIVAGRIAKLLTEEDFQQNRESLDELYQQLGVRGSMLGVMVDGLYTVADIVNPLCSGYERVLMVSGLEEHYFTELSKIVLRRATERYPDEIFPRHARLGALFLDCVPGLAGYPKMSKSIPDSAIHLGEHETDILRKIVGAGPDDDPVIMRMIELASGWDARQVTESRARFHSRGRGSDEWVATKQALAETFLTYARMWQGTAG